MEQFDDSRRPDHPLPLLPAAGIANGSALHHCTSCRSELVQPLAWAQAGGSHWEVSLRCPECEHITLAVHPQETVERYDEELERGTEALVRDLRDLVRSNLEDDIDRFAAALHADLVLPEDF